MGVTLLHIHIRASHSVPLCDRARSSITKEHKEDCGMKDDVLTTIEKEMLL